MSNVKRLLVLACSGLVLGACVSCQHHAAKPKPPTPAPPESASIGGVRLLRSTAGMNRAAPLDGDVYDEWPFEFHPVPDVDHLTSITFILDTGRLDSWDGHANEDSEYRRD